MTPPLAGITLVETSSEDCPLALRLAGEFTTRIACDLGAQVIRLVSGGHDPVRSVAPLAGDASSLFTFLNAGKQTLELPAQPRAWHACFQELSATADAVIVDDGMPLPDRGGDPGPARVTPPVLVQLSLFGAHGTARQIGSEFTVMALSGLLDTVGDPAREPLRLGGHQTAYAAGLAAYAGLAAALFARAATRSGESEIVRVSLLDTAIWLNWKNLACAACFASSPSRPGRGAQWQVVRCADGWMALIYMEKDWPALKAFVADARLDSDRFASEEGRSRHAREIGEIVEAMFLRHTRRELEAEARKRRLPLGAVWSPADLQRDAHYAARDVFDRVPLGDGCTASVPRLPVRWHEPPGSAAVPPRGVVQQPVRPS